MTKPQLSVRSAKAVELAHRLARKERRTVAAVVERALEEYATRHSGQAAPAAFYEMLRAECSADIDLEGLLAEHRRPHSGVKL